MRTEQAAAFPGLRDDPALEGFNRAMRGYRLMSGSIAALTLAAFSGFCNDVAAQSSFCPPGGGTNMKLVIPKVWVRNGLVLPRQHDAAGVSGDPCIVWDEAAKLWRMVLFYEPPGHAQAVCSKLDADGRGEWKLEGPLPVTNPEVVGEFHKPFLVMDPCTANKAALIQGRYCLLVVTKAAHKSIYRAWSEKLAGPWTFDPIPILTPGGERDFDGKHVDAVTGYYFAERQEFLYFYMGYPQEPQPGRISPYGSAQAVAVQKLGEKTATKLGIILAPSPQPGHWASGWVGGLQLLPGVDHRWLAVLNASPTAPDRGNKAVWNEEPPPSLGGFAWCDEEWPVSGWHFYPAPIEWIKDIPKSAIDSGEGYNLWRQFIHILPDGRAVLFYNSGYYGREQLYAKIGIGPTAPALDNGTRGKGLQGTAPVSGLGFMTGALASEAQSAPHINGPSVFGVRPGHLFFYAIPATGERPMKFAAEGLPPGLSVDAATGVIRGVLSIAGDYAVTLEARNEQGAATRRFVIKCGPQICLTPPMGWNSWNCWGQSVDQGKVLRAARAMIASGLAQHGWMYINIDDGWQGVRGGPANALQGNEKFPDMKRLCDDVHALGLRIGLYSTPWITSYAGYYGGSADNPDGVWEHRENPKEGRRYGRYSFEVADARQWATWGIDYLKYDWAPIDSRHAATMFRALSDSGRDIVLSLSNSADLGLAREWPKVANCWRTTGDIGDRWQYRPEHDDVWRWGVSEIAFSQDPWAASAGPGHWNDPDMLVVGMVGWGPTLHSTHLTHDEQYSHITMWCMLSAPLLLGCDLEQLDPFTLSLLTNGEVLAIDQDALGKQATRVATIGAVDVYLKLLEDGSHALAFFNRSADAEEFVFNKLNAIGLVGAQHVRDLWRQRDLPDCDGKVAGEISGHGVLLLRVYQ